MDDIKLQWWLNKYHISRWYFDQVLEQVKSGNYKMDHHSQWCRKKQCDLCDGDPWDLYESDKDSLLAIFTPTQWVQTVSLAHKYIKKTRSHVSHNTSMSCTVQYENN